MINCRLKNTYQLLIAECFIALMLMTPVFVSAQKSAEDAESEGNNKKQSENVLEPRYKVDKEARDPFFPPEQEGVSSKTLLEKAVSSLTINGLGTSGPKSGSVIIGSKMLKVGDEINVEVEGQSVAVEIKRFKPKSRSIVFGYKDKTVTRSMLD